MSDEPITGSAAWKLNEAAEEIERLEVLIGVFARLNAILADENAELRAEVERLTRERDHYLTMALEYQRIVLEKEYFVKKAAALKDKP